jgi:hypothetical protein
VSLALLPLVGACLGQARIDRLTVTPTEACPNDVVEASWSADGPSVQLRQEPPMSLTTARSSSDGIQGLSGDQDFDVVVETGRQEVTERRYVHVITEAWTFALSGAPRCVEGQIRVDVDFHMADPQMEGRMQVVSVSPRADRPLTIIHAGLPPVMLPLGSTATFQGTPLAGTWTLMADLKSGESCNGRGTAPLTPAVIVSGTCGGVPPRHQPQSVARDVAPRCGNLGQVCCASACQGAYRCDERTARCVDPQRPSYLAVGQRCNRAAATELSRAYYVPVRDGHGCGEIVSHLADSQDEATDCIRQNSGGPVTVIGATIRRYDFCKNHRVRVFVAAFSPDDARQCAQHLWPNAQLESGLCEQG